LLGWLLAALLMLRLLFACCWLRVVRIWLLSPVLVNSRGALTRWRELRLFFLLFIHVLVVLFLFFLFLFFFSFSFFPLPNSWPSLLCSRVFCRCSFSALVLAFLAAFFC